MNSFVLWDNELFTISTPKNPHTPYSEGLHVVVAPKQEIPNAWADVEIVENAFKLAAQSCKIMEALELAPWFNIQANGNWGLLPDAKPFFHVHIYGRNMTESWGKPIILPVAPGTYHNDPMPEAIRSKLTDSLKNL